MHILNSVQYILARLARIFTLIAVVQSLAELYQNPAWRVIQGCAGECDRASAHALQRKAIRDKGGDVRHCSMW